MWLPYSSLNGLLGFAPLSPLYLLGLGIITALYLLASEVTRRFIYRRAALMPKS